MSNLADRALSEAMALLAEVKFDSVRGAYRQGELTAVSIVVDSESTPEVCHIRVMCHDPGHLGVNWGSILPVLLERPSGELLRIGYMDPRGRSEFRQVPASGDSGFGLLFERIDRPEVVEADVPITALGGDFAAMDLSPVELKLSPDGSLSVHVEVVGLQRIFEVKIQADVARFPRLCNGEVLVVLRSKSRPSDIWLQEKVMLNSEGTGSWSGTINPSADSMLLVIPIMG